MLHRPFKKQPKDTYEIEFKQETYFSGGTVQTTSDGSHLFTTCRDSVKIVDISTGLVVNTIFEEDDPAVTCFCLTPDNEQLIVASENRLLRLWDWRNQFLTRSWKSIHTGPILEMTVDKTSTLLATGSSDMTIKIWDVDRKYYTHNLKGHRGVITAMNFHDENLWLLSSSMDLVIKVWNLQTSECIANLEGHYSAVTCLVTDPDNSHLLISGGRDNVLLLWDLHKKTRSDTIPVYESIESVVVLKKRLNNKIKQTKNDLHVVTAGSKGVLRVWNIQTRQCVFEQASRTSKDSDTEADVYSITQAFAIPELSQICTTNHEHNIQFYSTDDLSLSKQVICIQLAFSHMEKTTSNNDEILDVQLFGPNEEYLAVAANSATVKVYSISNFDSNSLHGHTDLVTCLAVSTDGYLLLSGSKDNTAILWYLGEGGIRDIHKIYTAFGHTQNVCSVALPKMKNSVFYTGGVDNTLKIWRSSAEDLVDSPEQVCCAKTEHAHDRDINSIDVSPNDKLIATSSRDKTAKIWRAEDLALLGVLKGHRRGIWKARFSPVDQCVITASADGTVKIFALNDFSCIKTFEGHDSPVLNVCFVTRGMQFVSCDDNGFIKLWNIKDNELVKTFEAHSERCWALTSSKATQDRLVSGGSDAAIIIWKDVTEEKVVKERKKEEKALLRQQELSNLLHEKRYHEALSLALTMEMPFHTLNIVKEILKLESEAKLYDSVSMLQTTQIDTLLRFCTEWNTNNRSCHEAQLLINQVLQIHPPESLLELANIKSILEGLLPYTERHYQRMSKLVQQTEFVDYTWQCMRLGEQSSHTD